MFASSSRPTNLRPDLLQWLASLHLIYKIELTMPLKAAVEEAYERKKLKYNELAANTQ